MTPTTPAARGRAALEAGQHALALAVTRPDRETLEADVDSAREQYNASHSPDDLAYWLAMLELLYPGAALAGTIDAERRRGPWHQLEHADLAA